VEVKEGKCIRSICSHSSLPYLLDRIHQHQLADSIVGLRVPRRTVSPAAEMAQEPFLRCPVRPLCDIRIEVVSGSDEDEVRYRPSIMVLILSSSMTVEGGPGGWCSAC
jgi:hypothetical protein